MCDTCEVLHETAVCECQVDRKPKTTLCTTVVFPGLLFRSGRSSGFVVACRAGVGRAAGAAEESRILRPCIALVTDSWLLGTESPTSLIRRRAALGCSVTVRSLACGAWVLRFSNRNPCVPAVLSSTQQGTRRVTSLLPHNLLRAVRCTIHPCRRLQGNCHFL